MVGGNWASGEFAIYEEHLYTESVQAVHGSAIADIPRIQGRAAARVLLTTLPQEQHGLGLLMAEAIFTLEGASCMSLGVQTPACGSCGQPCRRRWRSWLAERARRFIGVRFRLRA